MIGVITASKTSGSVLGYDLGDKKEKDQKIQILATEGVIVDPGQVTRLNQNWTDAASLKEFKYISRAVADDLAKQFDSQASVNDRVVRTTGHIALSFSPKDRPRLQDNDFKVQLATEYMEQMGIVDTQWVITEHFDTSAPHLHIAYNRVKYDGTVIDSKNERYRSQKIAFEISQKYSLTPAGEAPRQEKSLTSEQQLYSQMRTLAMEALQESCTMEEFKLNLRKRGIELCLSEHSEQKKSYGISYAMGEISAKGSKLDRSALSYAKVSITLERNLFARQAQEWANIQKTAEEAKDQERAKAKELYDTYGKMVPTVKELAITVQKTFDLYQETKEKGLAISVQTTEKFNELRNSWAQFKELNKERKSAQTIKGLSKAIGGMLMLLNPLAGLLVMAVGSIAADIRISSINAEKKALLGKIEHIKNDIDTLKTQKAKINLEKKERLNQYLQAKDARKEFQEGMDAIKTEIREIRIQELKRQFPFKEPGHIQYIIHGPMDASIFHCGENSKVFRKTNIRGGTFNDDRIEAARVMLKNKGYMVASDQGPEGELGFYKQLLNEQKNKDYRVGSMFIQPDGKIVFGQEKIFGEAEKTAPVLAPRQKFVQSVQKTEEIKQPIQNEPAAKPRIEVVWESQLGIFPSRIIRDMETGLYRLQNKERGGPIVKGVYTQSVWKTKGEFSSFVEFRSDTTYNFLQIIDKNGKTRYINQYGYDLTAKQLRKLGLGEGKGMGGRSI